MNSTQINIKDRHNALLDWLRLQLKTTALTLLPMTGDASFRYYHRIKEFPGLIAVDAAPDLANDNKGFVEIARLLHQLDLHVPEVFASDLDDGFLLISDLGDKLYLSALKTETADDLYGSALDSLERMQYVQSPHYPLIAFDDEWMRRELENFRTWLVVQFLQCELDSLWQKKLTHIFEQLIKSATGQPQVFIHRDYHSRNLLVCDKNPGILDFQDGMIGPMTYDAVSLLRDAYIAWPQDKVQTWAESFYLRVSDRHMHKISHDHFIEAFDLMGVQRHLKAAFIFARKYLRDDVDGYLADIPRTLHYVLTISQQYPALQDLHTLLTDQLLPALAAKGYTQ
jgi:N-acetylmuramate 1-kinase